MNAPVRTMADISWPVAACCMGDAYQGEYPSECVCPPAEAALRAWSRQSVLIPAMTAEQRDWCLAEIDSVEGHKAADHTEASDADLAYATLDAWTDYARDKGLL